MNLRRTAIYIIGLALVCFAGDQAAAQQSGARLISDQELTLHGKLRVVHRGFISYVLLDVGTTYIADGGTDEGIKKVSLIEIDSNRNKLLLAKHAGEQVTAKGKLFVDFAAPVPLTA